MRSVVIVLAFLSVLLFIALQTYAAEYHVKLDGTGDFTAIQEAIDVARDGDTIVVHPGTFYENIHFEGKNITLTSTDIWDRDVVEATVIDGQQLASVVTFAGTEDETCELSGFTITNGRTIDDGASGSVVTFAGAENETCELSGLTITNGEIAGRGAGIKGQDAECNIRNCIITGNIATGSMSDGAGMDRCCGVISNCVIKENEILDASLYSDRAAVSDCDAIITECLVRDNKCNGMIWDDGVMSNCIIRDNSGMGVRMVSGIMFNCTITGNSGTGVTCYEGIISNCLISYN
ncbi:MAG TPA: right-handed parallel beta-helix repeat-containing protein, partial [bacterium]|nr:right-handed parallel beta-helix repeat-containing protein [bacterium]